MKGLAPVFGVEPLYTLSFLPILCPGDDNSAHSKVQNHQDWQSVIKIRLFPIQCWWSFPCPLGLPMCSFYEVTQQTKKGLHFCKPLYLLVPGARLELARGCPRRILSPLRLPIPPSRQTDQGTWAMPHMHGVSGFVAQGAPIRQALSAFGCLIGPKQHGTAARQRSRSACPPSIREPI